MLLALDVGNTNITLGIYEGEKLRFVSRMATDASRMEDQYAIELRDILSIYGIKSESVDGAVISSVVPKLTEYISNAVHRLFSIQPFVVNAKTVKGLKITIDRPETTGPDLIAGCVAAKQLYSCPCIVIDMGTATTVLVMDKDEQLCGGCIIPGLQVSLDALVNRAALLSSISLGSPERVIATSTAEAIQAGVLYGAAAMLDGLCDRIEEELGYPCRVIATGGLARMVVKNCKRPIEFSDTLLLDGLKLIYDEAR